jgi:hypothetical protein
MSETIYYVGECPLCEQGLCRIRVCFARCQIFGCVVCDECEATWTDPTLEQRFSQPCSAEPICPKCGVGFWTDQSRWGDVADICLLGWKSNVKAAEQS